MLATAARGPGQSCPKSVLESFDYSILGLFPLSPKAERIDPLWIEKQPQDFASPFLLFARLSIGRTNVLTVHLSVRRGCEPNERIPLSPFLPLGHTSQAAAQTALISSITSTCLSSIQTQELVALSGAHTLGGKGFGNPNVFDNAYYKILLEKPWASSGSMSSMIGLPSDHALAEDDECLRWIKIYAADEAKFFDDFSNAYVKLVDSGAVWGSDKV